MPTGIQRIVTALVGAPLVVGLTWLGGWWFGSLVLAAGWLGMYELYHLVRREGPAPSARWGFVLGSVIILHPLVREAGLAAGLVLLALLASAPFWRSNQPLQKLEATLFGAVYPCLLLSMILRLRLGRDLAFEESELLGLTLGVLGMVWATDIAAYYVGKNWGRRRFFPEISPRKTWEGAAAGGLACLAVAWILRAWILPGLGHASVLTVALGCAAFTQTGDLLMSRIKRVVEAKDSGRILPGHGGILDRIDGLLLAGPYVYAFLYVSNYLSG